MPSQLSISISKCWAFGAGRLGHQMRAARHLVQQARHLARAGLHHDVGPAFFRHGVRAACIMCAAAQHHNCGPTSEFIARGPASCAHDRTSCTCGRDARPGIIRAARHHPRAPESFARPGILYLASRSRAPASRESA